MCDLFVKEIEKYDVVIAQQAALSRSLTHSSDSAALSRQHAVVPSLATLEVLMHVRLLAVDLELSIESQIRQLAWNYQSLWRWMAVNCLMQSP